jgi:hypothetical protein
MTRTTYAILASVMLCGMAFLWAAITVLCPAPRVLQRDVPPVQCDPWGEFNRSVRDAAWRNPLDGRPSDMPGGLR